MPEDRRHGERRGHIPDGEECCATVVKVQTSIAVWKMVLGGMWALLLVLLPLTWSKLDDIQQAIVKTQVSLSALASTEAAVAQRLSDHMAESDRAIRTLRENH